MRTRASGLAALGLALALGAPLGAFSAPALAQDAASTARSEAIDPIAAAKSRASLLWMHDQAAWHSTDVMLAQQKRASKEQREALNTVRGWVVTPDARGWLVVYYTSPFPDTDNPRAVFSAVWTGNGDKVVDPRWHVGQGYFWTADQLALIEAADVVPAPMLGCTRANLNRVVMPDPATPDQILVYYMTPQEKTGLIPFGRHSHFVVKDGAVTDRFNVTKGCIALPSAGPDGKQPPAMGVSNFTSATPTEFHLFAARTAGLPVVTMNAEDKPNFVLGWKDGAPFIEPISDLQELDRFLD